MVRETLSKFYSIRLSRSRAIATNVRLVGHAIVVAMSRADDLGQKAFCPKSLFKSTYQYRHFRTHLAWHVNQHAKSGKQIYAASYFQSPSIYVLLVVRYSLEIPQECNAEIVPYYRYRIDWSVGFLVCTARARARECKPDLRSILNPRSSIYARNLRSILNLMLNVYENDGRFLHPVGFNNIADNN
eukprot:COSAG02_NODE_1079_length_14711_cov_86.326512_15_plen_186_part_00